MLADISKGSSAQQCIGDGMKDDVGIAVARKPAVVGHFDTP